MAFEAALTQRLDDFRCRDRRVVRTKEHTGDRNLHARRLRRRKEPRQLRQALAVRNMLSRERVECADLDFGVARMGDARGRRAKLSGVGQWTVSKIDLRQGYMIEAGIGSEPQRLIQRLREMPNMKVATM